MRVSLRWRTHCSSHPGQSRRSIRVLRHRTIHQRRTLVRVIGRRASDSGRRRGRRRWVWRSRRVGTTRQGAHSLSRPCRVRPAQHPRRRSPLLRPRTCTDGLFAPSVAPERRTSSARRCRCRRTSQSRWPPGQSASRRGKVGRRSTAIRSDHLPRRRSGGQCDRCVRVAGSPVLEIGISSCSTNGRAVPPRR